MKKILLFCLLIIVIWIAYTNIILFYKNEMSSPTYNQQPTKKKCPNCGATSGFHAHETIPSLKICNTCGVAY